MGRKEIIRDRGLTEARLTGKYPSLSMAGEREGVVIARYYPDDKENVSKQFMEYEVRDLGSNQVYHNCRRLHQTSGVHNGTDDTLNPATEPMTKGAKFDPKVYPLEKSNGDRVLLGFINGAYMQAVIIGVLPHEFNDYTTKRVEGNAKFTTHENTSVETKNDGTFIITRNVTNTTRTTITLRPNGDIEMAHVSGAQLAILADGTVRVTGVGADAIKLGATAAQHVVLGDLFKSTYDAFVATYNGHYHAASSGRTSVSLAAGSSPVINPYALAPVPPAPNPYFGIPFVVDPAIIAASKSTPFPLPDQPTSTGSSPMPASNLSNKVVSE